MVFANDIAHDTSRLFVGTVPVVIQFMHGEQNAPVYRLKSVTGIGKCPANDYAHCVVEVAPSHFFFKTDGQGFFGELGHEKPG